MRNVRGEGPTRPPDLPTRPTGVIPSHVRALRKLRPPESAQQGSAVKASLRFAILRRDRFTCTYCGGTPPKVLLEVDHILPRSEGGTDDEANLCTACTDCNRGKGAKRLEESLAASVGDKSAAALRERLAQAREFAELQAEVEAFRAEQVVQFWEAWCREFRGTEKDGYFSVSGGFPLESRVRAALERAPLHVLIDAARIAAEKFDRRVRYKQTFAYFWAVVRNMMAEAEGGE